MWIRTQDKTWTYKVDNFGRYELGTKIYAKIEQRQYILLGEYKTVKRAEEILDEIHEYYLSKSRNVYEMPLE